ncbi:MAG: hypothetical protein ACRDO7_09190 [Nocardioidaceae bacterium]
MTGGAPSTESRADHPWWRRRLAIGAFVIVAAVGAGAAAVALRDDDTDRPTAGGAPDRGQTLIEYVACARVIATGDFVQVRARPASRLELTFDVRDWIKPAHGRATVRFDVVDDRGSLVDNPWKPHENVLVVVPTNRRVEADAYLDDDRRLTRDAIEEALPRATGTRCPPVWREMNE